MPLKVLPSSVDWSLIPESFFLILGLLFAAASFTEPPANAVIPGFCPGPLSCSRYVFSLGKFYSAHGFNDHIFSLLPGCATELQVPVFLTEQLQPSHLEFR